MKHHAYILLLLTGCSINSLAQQTPIFPKGEKAANIHHVGNVWLTELMPADSVFTYSTAQAVFDPGARLDWHQHPAKIDDIGKYDVIFVGFPTWGMKLPPPMKSFLSEYDLSGKTVVPFNTNAGYGTGSTFDTVRELCKNSKVLQGFSIKGGVERDGILFVMEGKKEEEARAEVKKWLHKIEILK